MDTAAPSTLSIIHQSFLWGLIPSDLIYATGHGTPNSVSRPGCRCSDIQLLAAGAEALQQFAVLLQLLAGAGGRGRAAMLIPRLGLCVASY